MVPMWTFPGVSRPVSVRVKVWPVVPARVQLNRREDGENVRIDEATTTEVFPLRRGSIRRAT